MGFCEWDMIYWCAQKIHSFFFRKKSEFSQKNTIFDNFPQKIHRNSAKKYLPIKLNSFTKIYAKKKIT